MVIDSSAVISILFAESDALQYAQAIQLAESSIMSAASFLETAIVIEARHGLAGGAKLDQFFSIATIRVEPVTIVQANVAREAFRAYGKGRHPAGLNFGDCFSYALAKVAADRLLFKGNDFSQTDVQPAISP